MSTAHPQWPRLWRPEFDEGVREDPARGRRQRRPPSRPIVHATGRPARKIDLMPRLSRATSHQWIGLRAIRFVPLA